MADDEDEDNPLGFPLGTCWRGEVWQLAPVGRLGFSVKLAERVKHHLAQHRLNSLRVFWGIVLEYSRSTENQFRGGTYDRIDTLGNVPFPVGANQ